MCVDNHIDTQLCGKDLSLESLVPSNLYGTKTLVVVVSYSDSCTTVMPLSKQMDYVMGRSLWMLLPTCQVRFVTFTRQTCCCLCTSQVTHTRYSSIITQKYQYSCLGMALKGESEAMRANKIYMKDQSGVKLPQINPFG